MNVFGKNINRSVFVNVICAVLTAAALLSFVLPSAVFAAGETTAPREDIVSEPSSLSISDLADQVVTKDGKVVKTVEKGDTVTVTAHFRCETLSVEDCFTEAVGDNIIYYLKSYKLSDSFNETENTSVTATVNAQTENSPLEVVITASNIVYSGNGNKLILRVINTGSYDEITLPVSECVEYVEPDEPEPETYPEPKVMITRDSIGELEPGDEFTLTLNFENKSEYYTLEDPTVSVTLPAGLIPLEQTLTQSIRDIRDERTRSASFRFKVDPEADSLTLSVDVTIKYHYTTEDGKSHDDSASETVYIPLTITPQEPVETHVPELRIERDALAAVKSGEEFTLRLYIWNANAYATATTPVVKLDVSDGFSLIDTTESRYISDIYPQSPAVVDVKLRAPDEISKRQYTIGVNVEYGYEGAEARKTASENVIIQTEPTTPATADTNKPALEITRGDMSAVKAGEEFTLRLYIKNTSADKAAASPTVKLTVPSGLVLLDSTESKHIPDIAANSQAVVDVKLRAAEDISSQSQTVGVAVSYSYKEGSETKEGDASENVIVPTVPSSSGTSDNKKPVLRITRGELGTVKADQSFTLTVTVENLGDVTIDDVVAKVTINGDLLIMDSTPTHYLSPLAPGKSETFKVKMKASSTISSESQSVTVHVDYTYPSATGAAESADETLFVQTKKTDTTDLPADEQGATPKVLISKYGFGDEAQVAAGSTFDLNMTFCNTSADYEVENVMITLSPSTGLSISSSSNTIYYASMGVGEEVSETVGIQALPTAETGSISINVTIEYQYKVAGAYQSTSIQQSIAIPIYQPDRFEVELSGVPEFATAYQEMYISMPYINKGKSTISNVRAEVVSEDGAVSALQTVQNLGNFESGRNGTIDFIVTPYMSGEVTFTIRITYEDPNAQEKTLDYPITLNVEEPYYPPYDDPGYIDDPTIDPGTEENNGLPWWAWALIGAGVIIVLTIVIVKVTKRRKLKKSHRREFSWDDVDDEAEDVNSGVGDTYVGGKQDGKK